VHAGYNGDPSYLIHSNVVAELAEYFLNCTTGRPSAAAWTCRRLGDCGCSRTRNASASREAAGRRGRVTSGLSLAVSG
jgi:hypothetical protein